MTSKLNTAVNKIIQCQTQGLPYVVQLTEAWYAREHNVELNGQLFATALVNDDRRVNIHAAVVEELDRHEREDKRRREQREEGTSPRFDLDILHRL